MHELLKPFPQGYWVTRNGVIVKLTADAVVWPNGTRERLHVDLETGFLQVCSMTCLPTSPTSVVRRARFVASELLWECGDHWVIFEAEDEDPRGLVVAEPSEETVLSESAQERWNSEHQDIDFQSEEEEEEENDGDLGRSAGGDSSSTSLSSFGRDSCSSHSSDAGMRKAHTAPPPLKRGTTASQSESVERSPTARSSIIGSPPVAAGRRSVMELAQVAGRRSRASTRRSSSAATAGMSSQESHHDMPEAAARSPTDEVATGDASPELGRKSAISVSLPGASKKAGSANFGPPPLVRRLGNRRPGSSKMDDQTPQQSPAQLAFTDMMQQDLKSRFQGLAQEGTEEQRQVSQTLDVFKVGHLARDLGLTHDELREAVRIFTQFDPNRNGSLTRLEFESAAVHVIADGGAGNDVNLESLRSCCEDQWNSGSKQREARGDDNAGMNMQEFLTWFSANRFNVDLTHSKEQRSHTDLARKYRCTEKDIYDVKLNYDQVDKDSSGNICSREFQSLLRLLMRLPGDAEIPHERVASLWREIDTDGSGFACFEEFVRWWLKRKDCLVPYHNFYKTVRDLSQQHYDPPVNCHKP